MWIRRERKKKQETEERGAALVITKREGKGTMNQTEERRTK